MRSARLRLVRLVALVIGLAAITSLQSSPLERAARAQSARPDIVIVLTDDQRFDQLGHMPAVRTRLAARGVTFDQGFVVDPLCCPSRLSILRGQYSHTTGIYGVSGPYGGFGTIRARGLERPTVATWLDGGGYRTAMVGKYLNGYGDAAYVPPGWDFWRALVRVEGGRGYYDYEVSENGIPRAYGSTPEDYSTDVLAGYAERFVRTTLPGQPLFLHLSFRAPHMPAPPAPRHATDPRCGNEVAGTTPSFNEADVSDKPEYIRSRPLLTDTQVRQTTLGWPKRVCRALLSVDEGVARVLGALRETGRLSNTLIFFLSDNGALLGEHRWRGKKVPYEESIRVPFIVRYDPLTADRPGLTLERLVLNIDIAPTIAEATGIAPDIPQDGQSLVPLLQGAVPGWRSDFLVEHHDLPDQAARASYVPPYCAVRKPGRLFVRYATGEEEHYDLVADPYQLRNLAGDPAFADMTKRLRGRARELCSPLPPDFQW